MLNVFITGASSGIGAALARQYAAGGATVGLVARNAEKLQAVVESLPGDPKRHFAFPADVTKREEICEAAARFEKFSGGATLVIANAGMSHGVKTEFLEDLDVLEAVYRLNVFAMAYTFHAFIGPMKARGGGRLVGIGSVADFLVRRPIARANPQSSHIVKACESKCRSTALALRLFAQALSVRRLRRRTPTKCRSFWSPKSLPLRQSMPSERAKATR